MVELVAYIALQREAKACLPKGGGGHLILTKRKENRSIDAGRDVTHPTNLGWGPGPDPSYLYVETRAGRISAGDG